MRPAALARTMRGMKGVPMKLFVISALTALGLAGGQAALAANSTHHAATPTLTVAMRDPGCHWFLVHGKFTTKASVAGSVRLRNLGEATLKVASRSKLQYIKVGHSIVLSHGSYVVMMVGQAVDDNYLRLTVR
jgi:hypothetical protein